MLDKNTFTILKILNKLADTDYKVITIEEIIAANTGKLQFDDESVKQIILFLSKQEYINIKFSEDNTYCYSILPKAKQLIEQGSPKKASKRAPYLCYFIVGLASFVGTLLALLVFYMI